MQVVVIMNTKNSGRFVDGVFICLQIAPTLGHEIKIKGSGNDKYF